ncbi:hypothetical protein [Pseudomonas putida]|uniref:hypothetical protein n=1 Tax=Pseudomonas putida TaxID=303 RepID=UPI003822FE7D
MRRLMVAALAAVALGGCGEPDSQSTSWIGGVLPQKADFRFPGSVIALKSKSDGNAKGGRAWFFESASWRPKGWSLWIASNVYSDYMAPGDDRALLRNGFGKADTAAERSAQDSIFIGGVSQWLKANHVDVEVNFLGYDGVPGSLAASNAAYNGYWLTFNNAPCDKAFRLCIDNYFVSPAARVSGGSRLSFKEWITPYLQIGTDSVGMGQMQVINHMGGLADENSKFYDYWPTMVFLVSPEGKVTRAWLPQKNDVATVGKVQAAIVTDVAGKYKDVAVSDGATARPSSEGYYGQHYIESGVTKVLETFKEIMDSK